MASNLRNAISAHNFYVTINSKYHLAWRDFTLQKGHVYGYSPELDSRYHETDDNADLNGLFVVYGERKDFIILYVASVAMKNGTADRYLWRRHAIYKNSRTGDAIMPVLAKRQGGVRLQPLKEQDITKIYNPPLIKTKYTPMPSMRIPGGSYQEVFMSESDLHMDGKTTPRTEMVIRNIKQQGEYRRRKNNGVYENDHRAS